MVKAGADVHATERHGQTSLMYVVTVAAAQLLLDAGAAVNARCTLGSIVLHSAAARGVSAGVICCLLKAGADATATDTVGSTPADTAAVFGHSAVAALLHRAAADQRCRRQQQQQQQQQQSVAMPLPEHLQLGRAAATWHSSSDMTHRRKIHLQLVQFTFRTANGDCKAVDLQDLEFQLYKRAASLAEYRDSSTIAARVNALCRTRLRANEAAAAAAAAADTTAAGSSATRSAVAADRKLAAAVALQEGLADAAGVKRECQALSGTTATSSAAAAAPIAAAAVAAEASDSQDRAEKVTVAAVAATASALAGPDASSATVAPAVALQHIADAAAPVHEAAETPTTTAEASTAAAAAAAAVSLAAAIAQPSATQVLPEHAVAGSAVCSAAVRGVSCLSHSSDSRDAPSVSEPCCCCRYSCSTNCDSYTCRASSNSTTCSSRSRSSTH
jgi:hypothetical protein